MTTGKRMVVAKGKGYLNAAGPQARFIVFLLIVLISFTLLLRVFQKLSEILQFPLFLPISLVTLFIFIAIVGTLYSHRFLGPVARIRRAMEQMATGDFTVCLRLRETDDPMLKDLANALTGICDHTRNAYGLIQDAASDLFNEIGALREIITRGAETAKIKQRLESIRTKQEVLDRAIKAFRKA